ncbi:MAG: segregation/condensation protein A [Clostridia bacterium]|nr:segregation/condensation protein A [Clostridia bacterium]
MAKSIADNFESNVDYTTVLDGFEGPLDLLLFLINKEEIEIKDIFVSQVTEQFLDYMKGLQYIDVDKASEYLNIASTILAIKAKSLVPQEDLYEEEYPEADDEAELIRALEEYKLLKEESEKLKKMETVGYFFKAPDRTVGKVNVVYKDFTLEGLIDAFTKMMLKQEISNREKTKIRAIPKDVFTVAEKVTFIKEALEEKEELKFDDLFSTYSKNEVITTFQAMLELLKHQYLCVRQEETFDTITITLNPDRGEEVDLGEIDEYN